MIMIFPYSDIKIMANNQEPYSILNPEINSDSPSARSNGTRFNSARIEINQIIKIGSRLKIKGYNSCTFENDNRLNL